MIKIFCIKNNSPKMIDISNVVKDGTNLKKNLTNFSWTMEFGIAKNNVFDDIELGDIMVIKLDDKEIFSGVVINSDLTNNTYQAIDYCWYFSNNEEIRQIQGIEASVVVKNMLEQFGATVGQVDSCNTMIDKLFFGKTIGAIIKEIIQNIKELENLDFRFFYHASKFYFVKSKKTKYKQNVYTPISALNGVLNENIFNALDYITVPTRKASIENMRNCIKVFQSDGKDYRQIYNKKNDSSIIKYGLMQKLVEIKDGDNFGEDRANNMLLENNKVEEKISLELPLLSQFLDVGELLELNYEKFNIHGVYEITNISYTFSNHKTIFKASLDLERVV